LERSNQTRFGIYLKELKNTSYVCGGGPGREKTVLASYMYEDETLVLCYQNKVCQSMHRALRKRHGFEKSNVFTFSSMLEHNRSLDELKKYKRIIVDEYTQTPMFFIQKLYELREENPNVIIQMFGDHDQCSAIQDDKRFYNYLNHPSFHKIINHNILLKEYVEGCARFTNKLQEVLSYLLKYHRLPNDLSYKKLNPDVKLTSLCKTNEKRYKVIDEVTKEIGPTKDLFNGRFYIGQTVIVKDKNIKSLGLYNGQTYIITQRNNKNKIAVSEDGDEPLSITTKEGKKKQSSFRHHYLIPLVVLPLFDLKA
jgi:hypothetical protein